MNVQFFLSIFFLLSFFPSLSHEVTVDEIITVREWEEKAKDIVGRIPEFALLAKEAQKRGLKLALFGGSAATFAHYVKDSILFERGFDQYYSEYFERDHEGHLDYTDIFRPTQDMDIVADGELERIVDFEREIMSIYPHLRGSKKKWEVRSLRTDYRDKQALLNNPDFFNQHTDSHSVGLIFLDVNSPSGEFVKDVYHWDESYPRFLRDVLSNRLHYYYRLKHKTTSRYKEGKNPEIFSVIRYYIKLFQHRLISSEEDKENIKRIIFQTNWSEIQREGYVNYWLEENVPKLFLHAQDVEYAANVLADSGLKEKLSQVGSVNNYQSPAWWVNKEPLRSFDLGAGEGRTAGELGIKVVAHDTENFFIWTVITRSRKGEPNVLISRRGIVGESAFYGPGFYTMKNQRVGKNGKFSIRFTVNPDAREGSDFELHGNILLVLNRNAISVIPESIGISRLLEYFEFLRDGSFEMGDEGLFEKFRRKVEGHSWKVDEGDVKKIIEILKSENNPRLWSEWFSLKISHQYPIITYLWEYFKLVNDVGSDRGAFRDNLQDNMKRFLKVDKRDVVQVIETLKIKNIPSFWRVWFGLEISHQYPLFSSLREYFEIVGEHVDSQNGKLQKQLRDNAEKFLKMDEREISPIVSLLNDEGKTSMLWFGRADGPKSKRDKYKETLRREWPALKISAQYPELMKKMVKEASQDILSYYAQHVFPLPHWAKYPRILKLLIKRGNQLVLHYVASNVFSQPHWRDYSRLISSLIERAENGVLWHLMDKTFPGVYWENRPELAKTFIERGHKNIRESFAKILPESYWEKHPDVVNYLIKKGGEKAHLVLVKKIFWNSHLKVHRSIMEYLIEKADQETLLALADARHTSLLARYDEGLLKLLIERGNWRIQLELAYMLIGSSRWKEHSHLIEDLIDKLPRRFRPNVAEYLIVKTDWKERIEIVEYLMETGNRDLLYSVVRLIDRDGTGLKDHPQIVRMLIKRKSLELAALASEILSRPYMKDHPELAEEMIDRGGRYIFFNQLVLARFIQMALTWPHWRDHPELIEKLIRKDGRYVWTNQHTLLNLARHVLSKPFWKDYPELVVSIIKGANSHVLKFLDEEILSQDHWKNHPRLIELCKGQDVTANNIVSALKQQEQQRMCSV